MAREQDEFDKELDDLLAANMKKLSELHSDMKEVSRIVGEPTVNIRKLNPGGKKVLGQSSNSNVENQADPNRAEKQQIRSGKGEEVD